MKFCIHICRYLRTSLLALVLYVFGLYAQPSRFLDGWRWKEFNLESGVPSTLVYAIAETPRGVPWVFTSGGIAWYDEYIWHKIDFPAELPLRNPTSFYSDASGKIVLVYDSTLYTVSSTGFKRFTFQNVIQAVPLDDGSAMLLKGVRGQSKRIEILHGENLNPVVLPESMAEGAMPELRRTESGKVWLNVGHGLYTFDNGGWSLRFLATTTDFPLAYSSIAENQSESGIVLLYRPFSVRGLWEWRSGNGFVLNTLHKGEDITGADVASDGTAILSYGTGYFLLRHDGKWSIGSFNQLSGRQVTQLKFRPNGDLWICTEKGLRLLKYSSDRWHFESRWPLSPESYVNDILIATDSSIWLATGAGIRVHRKDGRKTSFTSLLGKNIYTATGLLQDREGNIWVCSGSDFTGAYKWDGKQWTHIGSGTPLASAHIHRMYLDRSGKVWLLGISKNLEPSPDEKEPGAFVYDKGKITRWGVSEGLPVGRVYTMADAEDGVRWFGTIGGLSKWRNGVWHHYGLQQLFSAAKIYSIAIDSSKRLWFTDGKGIVGTIDSSGNVNRISTKDGLLDNRVLEIRVDENSRVWCTTPIGLAVYSNGTWGHYDEVVGMPNSLLWPVLPARNTVYVGSHSGLITLNLSNEDFEAPRVFFDQPLVSGQAAILRWRVLSLWNSIPSKEIATRYRIDAEAWSSWATSREVSLQGLNSGEHDFEVQTRPVLGGISSFKTAKQSIVISIPLTGDLRFIIPLSVLIVALLAAAITSVVREKRSKQRQLREELRREHEHAERLAAVDKLKSRFFANISHEFRTPLTLVIGPIGQALSKIQDSWVREKLSMAHRNAEKLHDLINQLLDFSKIESGTMKVSVRRGDVVPFVLRIVQSFQSWAEQKNQTLELVCTEEKIIGYFDRSNLEKMLNNLISNALKFTPEGGVIRVQLAIHEDEKVQPDKRPSQIQISVSDNGIGISEEHLAHIFDRFYRVDDSHVIEGTGIGLALTKELVELLHGRISAKSQSGVGTEFTVVFPLHFEPGEIASDEASEGAPPAVVPTQYFQEISAAEGQDDKAETIVLIVEDSADVRAHIKDYLTNEYTVIEAGDGYEGLTKARSRVPDLIISDVMMPRMDGYQLARELKRDERTSHIPVVLLTARAGSNDKVEGLELGADDYLTKPFDARELLARVKNLIENRRRLRERFSKIVPVKPGEVTMASMEDAFMQRAMETVDRCMGDEHFSVDQFSQQMNMSRMQLHRKLRALTNQSASEFIRHMRLSRAHEMLLKNVGTISEIAYQTGFGSLTYFERCYHEQFGCSPRDTRTPHT